MSGNDVRQQAVTVQEAWAGLEARMRRIDALVKASVRLADVLAATGITSKTSEGCGCDLCAAILAFEAAVEAVR